MKKWVLALRIVLLLISLLCLLSTAFLFVYEYENVTSLLAHITRQTDKLEKFRAIILTPARFSLLRIIAGAGTVICIALLIYSWNRIYYLERLLKKVKIHFKAQAQESRLLWQSLTAAQKYSTLVLFALIVCSHLYLLFRFPFHIDERFSYLYFVSKGLVVAMAYYPNPNNHILYSLICVLADVFISNPVVVMKLPAFLIGLLLPVTFWLVIIRYFPYTTAFVATALFAFAESVFYYSLHGRGYGLMMLFVLLATHSALKIVNTVGKPAFVQYLLLWLSCTLGFYTLPVFLYPFVSLLLFLILQLLLQKKYETLKYVVFTSIIVVVSVIVLYLPVFIFNGLHAVWGNSWVASQPWAQFLEVFPQQLHALAGGLWGVLPMGIWLTLGVIALSCLILVDRKEPIPVKQWLLLLILNIVVIGLMYLLQRTTLYRRVFTYLSIFQYVALALLYVKLTDIFKSFLVRKAWVVVLPVYIYVSLNMYEFYKLTSSQTFGLYDSFDATANWLYQRNANHVFVNMYEYSLCIRFQYETNGRAIYMDTNQPVAGSEYTYLVIHPSRPAPGEAFMAAYRKVYYDPEVAIYEKNEK